MTRRATAVRLLVLVLLLSSGCAVGERPGQADPQSFQLQRLEIDMQGTVGPHHGPYYGR